MEDWGRKADWDRDVLEDIVAMLFALAHLADLATGAPFLRRRQVLKIINHGEAEARAFIMGLPSEMQAPAPMAGKAGDAACLATRLRALALALWAMLARFALRGTLGPRIGRATPARPASGRVPPPVLDTS